MNILKGAWGNEAPYTLSKDYLVLLTAFLRPFWACNTLTKLYYYRWKPLYVFHNQQLYWWDTPLGNKCLAGIWQNQQIPQWFLQVAGRSPELLQLRREVACSRPQGCSASRLAAAQHPSIDNGCFRNPRRQQRQLPKGARCWHHGTALPQQGLRVEAMTRCKGKRYNDPCEDINPREAISVPEAVPCLASWSWISIWTTQLPPFSSNS